MTGATSMMWHHSLRLEIRLKCNLLFRFYCVSDGDHGLHYMKITCVCICTHFLTELLDFDAILFLRYSGCDCQMQIPRGQQLEMDVVLDVFCRRTFPGSGNPEILSDANAPIMNTCD